MRVFLTFALCTCSLLCSAQQSLENINRKLEKNWVGTIVFNDGREVECNFTYNPLTLEGLLLVKTDTITNVFGVTKVKSFSFFDDQWRSKRYFYTVPVYHLHSKEPMGKYFFEGIYLNSEISICGRVTVRVKVSRDSYSNITKAKLFDHYSKYLLDHKTNALYPLSKKSILRLTADREKELHEFLNQRSFRLRPESLEEYKAVIDYYSSLKEK